MRFSTIFSVLACGAMALAAAVAPDALVSRADTGISAVIGTLDTKCDSIISQFDDCKDSKCTESLVLDIVAAVDAATVACVDLEEVLDSGLAEKIVGVVIKLVTRLSLHKSSCDGKCGDLSVYAKFDLCLSLLLKQLGICVPGIMALFTKLLFKVVTILKGLSLSLILEVCALA